MLKPAMLGQRALRGLLWMLAQNAVARICSLFNQLVLAVLLQPADFGLIGLAYTVTTFASCLMNVGLDDVLLQRRTALGFWTGPAFWINMLLALAAGALVVIVAPFAAAIYHAPDLIGLLAVLALAIPLGALASVPGMILRARMQFRFIAIYGAAEMVAQTLMTVGLADHGFGAYSFVIPAPVLGLARVVIWWRLAAGVQNLRPKRKRWRYLIRSTATVFISRAIVASIEQGDYVVLGLIASQQAVGGYYFGFRLAAQPLWILAGNFCNVLYPVFIQLSTEPKRQGEAALRASTLLSFCVIPFAFVQAAVAAPLVTVLFSEKWVSSITVIQLLSIGLALDAVSWVARTLLSARGEFTAGLLYLLVQVPIFFAFVVAGALLGGATGVAWGVCSFYVITQPIYVYSVYRRFGMKSRDVVLLYVRPICYAAISVGSGLAFSASPWLSDHPFLQAAVILIVGGSLYAALVKWQAPAVWRELSGRVGNLLGRHTAA